MAVTVEPCVEELSRLTARARVSLVTLAWLSVPWLLVMVTPSIPLLAVMVAPLMFSVDPPVAVISLVLAPVTLSTPLLRTR
ncbi:hypothetical protein D3C80_1705000 [compost metagenome]